MAARRGRTTTAAAGASTGSDPEAQDEQGDDLFDMHDELVQLRAQVQELRAAKRDVPLGTPVLAQREREERGAQKEAQSDQGPRRSRPRCAFIEQLRSKQRERTRRRRPAAEEPEDDGGAAVETTTTATGVTPS